MEIQRTVDGVGDVDFTAEAHLENDGIGAYEYWGAKYYDKGVDYPVLDDDIKWNEDLYTIDQNQIIKSLPETFWQQLDSDFCKMYLDIHRDNQLENLEP